MADKISDLAVKLIADTSAYLSGFDQASREAEKLTTKVSTEAVKATKVAEDTARRSSAAVKGAYADAMKGAFMDMAGPLGGMASVGGAAMGMWRLATHAREVVREAERLHIGTEALQELEEVAHKAGMELGDVGMAVSRMERSIANAAHGDEKLVTTFRELHLSVERLTGLSPDRQLEAVAAALMSIQNPAERTRYEMELFGRTGAEMELALQQAARGLDQFQGSISDPANLKALSDAKKGIDDLAHDIVNKLMPALGEGAAAWKSFVEGTGAPAEAGFGGGVRRAGWAISPILAFVSGAMGGTVERQLRPLRRNLGIESSDWIEEDQLAKLGRMRLRLAKDSAKRVDEENAAKLAKETYDKQAKAAQPAEGAFHDITNAAKDLLIPRTEGQKLAENAIYNLEKEGKLNAEQLQWWRQRLGVAAEFYDQQKAIADRTKQDAEDAKRLATEKDRVEKAYWTDLQREADKFFDESLTPIERAYQEILKLDALGTAGLVDPETAKRMRKRIAGKWQQEEGGEPKQTWSAPGVGSAEAYKILMGTPDNKRTADGVDAMNKELKDHKRELERIEENTRNRNQQKLPGAGLS